ncbi:alpha/beta hydrolase family protein [Chitinophaga sp. 30R24]|uniref:alpha/beta hydrolase family protein n=1 Tax=Chitinophaga sp. 30R24 TaxID=3248838 RepID=UPI003B8EB708
MWKGFWMLLLVMLPGVVVNAQDNNNIGIAGKWYGAYKLYYGDKQRVIIQLQQTGSGYTGQVQFPDVADGDTFELESVVYRKDTLLLRTAEVKFTFVGVWDPVTKRFKGVSSFDSERSALELGRRELTRADLYKRPQEPKPPYPYYTEAVKFYNTKDGVSLSGTFTRPAAMGKYPVVVMLNGSGPQTRDDEMAGHKLFLVIADYFARNGIATLRYDDRGIGASSGDFDTSDIYGFARDAAAAMAYVKARKDVDPHSVGLLGHSEGAIVAQIVAANNPAVAFVISMAGVGLPGRELIDQQAFIKGKLEGKPDSLIEADRQRMKPYWDLLASDSNIAVVKPKAQQLIRELYRSSGEEVKKEVSEEDMVQSANLSPEAISILRYQPLTWLKQIKCPFMAINGTEDLQVDATSNLNAIQRALTENGNQMVTVRKFNGLNHLFQRCKTCTTSEYGELEQTIDPLVPEFMAHWIVQLPPSAR